MKEYVKPCMYAEEFVPNEYITACGLHGGSHLYLDYATKKANGSYTSGSDQHFQQTVTNIDVNWIWRLIFSIFNIKTESGTEKMGQFKNKLSSTSGWEKTTATNAYYYGNYSDGDLYDNSKNLNGATIYVSSDKSYCFMPDPTRPNHS